MRKLVILAALLAPATAAAQSTATPVFQAPYRAFTQSEFGVSLSDPGAGMAVEASYRYGRQRLDLGFRGGFHDANGGSSTILLGVDVRSRVLTHSADFPLDGALTLGVGALLNDGFNLFHVPVGLSLGRRVDMEGSDVSFVPYFQPVLGLFLGEGNSELEFGIGLGTDIRVGRTLDLRVSGAIGDYEGIAIGLAWLR